MYLRCKLLDSWMLLPADLKGLPAILFIAPTSCYLFNMAGTYNHKKIEKKWQKHWTTKKSDTTKDAVKGKKNHYLLVEFPYPSGNLHVGHWYAFAVPDIYARYMRAQGFNVLYPIGFDAFGLPAENAAIKRKLNPRKWTQQNIAYMKKQLASMGASFDWSREVATIDPAYYRWTQWMFTQFYKKGLAYQKETPANWCPSCKTVLANEQVVAGKCERCGTAVEQRLMLQWNLRITDYADRLLTDLDALDWPEQIKESQRNWIGKSEGALVDFPLIDVVGQQDGKHTVQIFTTRPDTIFGATYIAVSPDLAAKWLAVGWKAGDDVQTFIKSALKERAEAGVAGVKEKNGIFSGIYAINPAHNEKIPVWIANYVLGDVGTGAIMAVPAHDQRDYEFAKKYSLPIQQVVEPVLVQTTGSAAFRGNEPVQDSSGIIAVVKHWAEDKYLGLHWPEAGWGTLLTGGIDEGSTPQETVLKEIREETGYQSAQIAGSFGIIHSKYYHAPKKVNRFGHAATFYVELADDSREEISAEEASKHEMRWLSKNELRQFLTATSHLQLLEFLDSHVYSGQGLLVNSGEFNDMDSEQAKKKITEKIGGKWTTTYRLRDWGVSRQRYWGVPIPIIHCEKCGAVPVPEKDLPVKLPEIKDYLPTGDGKSPLAKVKKFVDVKCPQCKGSAKRETDTLDTFVDSSWYFLRYTDPKNKKTFADTKKQKMWMPVDFYSGGAEHTTMHLLYSRFWQKALFDLGFVSEKEPYKHRMNRGLILGPDGQKMSKSKGNVIDPDEWVAKLGADTVRLYLAFIGPYNEPGNYPWNTDSIVGVRRFLDRISKMPERIGKENSEETERALHKMIAKITTDIPELKFNTAIAEMMKFLNVADKTGIGRGQCIAFLRVLAPFAPHIAEELWSVMKQKGSVHQAPWPKADEAKLQEEMITIVVQVNSKKKGEVSVPAGSSEESVLAAIRKDEKLGVIVGQMNTPRIFFVPNRLINIVG
ncbi:MAG: class I tRNA ligase family protein [Parcubacteria group bacterium]|nr:class I tRNA ligase family protein [Parcubacteria group bacterium]